MAFLAFLRYALWSIVRNRRRTFTSMLGIVLAVTLIAGENIAIDSTARAILAQTLAQVPYDASASVYSGTSVTPAAVDALKSVDNVEEVVVVRKGPTSEIVRYEPPSPDPIHLTSATVVGVNGTLPTRIFPYRGAFLVSEGNATVAGFEGFGWTPSAGGTITLYSSYCESPNPINYSCDTWTNVTYNLTVASVLLPDEKNGTTLGGEFYGPLVFVDWEEMDRIVDAFAPSSYPELLAYNVYIWLDRDALIDPYDIPGSIARLRRTENRLRAVAPSLYPTLYYGLTGALDQFQGQMLIQRLAFLALSAPVVALGVYLGAVGVDLAASERRREVGVMKARGASDRQVLTLLALEAVIAGAAAGILGLLFGVAASRFLLAYAVTLTVAPPSLADLTVSADSVVLVILFSVFFMLLAGWRPLKRLARLSTAESLHFYSRTELAMRYRPTADVVMLTLAAMTYFFVSQLKAGPPEGGWGFVLFLLGGIFLVAFVPLFPFLLPIGLTRLLTRGTAKTYLAAARAVRPLLGNMAFLVSRNLARSPRRASAIAVITALGLAFGTFITTFTTTEVEFQRRLVRIDVGADVALDLYGPPVNQTARDNAVAVASSVPGVAAAALVQRTGEFAVIDPAAYRAAAVPVDAYYFTEGGPESLDALATKNNAIVHREVSRQQGLHVGDSFPYQYYDPENGTLKVVVFRIVGIAKALPGVLSAYAFGGPYGSPLVIGTATAVGMNLSATPDTGFSSARLLARLAPGADGRAVADALNAQLGPSMVRVLAEDLDLRRGIGGPLFAFLIAESYFAIVIITAGLGLLLYTAFAERRVELATIAARGAAGRHLGALLMGEALAIVLIGGSVGIGSGFATTFLYNDIASIATSGFGPAALDRPVVVGWETATLLLLAVGAILLAALVVAWRARRLPIAHILRERGG